MWETNDKRLPSSPRDLCGERIRIRGSRFTRSRIDRLHRIGGEIGAAAVRASRDEKPGLHQALEHVISLACGNHGSRLVKGRSQAATDRRLGEGRGHLFGQAATTDLALELLPQAVVLLSTPEQDSRLAEVRGEAKADPRTRVTLWLPRALVDFIERPVVLVVVDAQVFVDARERRRRNAVARKNEGLQSPGD